MYSLNRSTSKMLESPVTDCFSLNITCKQCCYPSPECHSDIFHEYWKEFEPVDYKIHVAIGVIMTLVGTLGFIWNVAVIAACCSPRWSRGRRSMLLYVMNLAIADCLVSAFGFPMMAVSSFHGSWMFNKIGCDAYSFICGIGGIASITTMSVIARERYYSITRDKVPSTHRGHSIRSHPLLVILAVWLFSGLMVAPPLFGWSRYILDGHGTSCTFDYITQTGSNKYFYLMLFVLGFLVPLLVTVTFYMLLFRYVWQHERQLEVEGHYFQRNVWRKNHIRRRELKLVKSCVLVVLTFVIAWTPYAVIAMASAFGALPHLRPIATLIPAVFAKFCVIYNPLIYTLSHPRFKSAFGSLFRLKSF